MNKESLPVLDVRSADFTEEGNEENVRQKEIENLPSTSSNTLPVGVEVIRGWRVVRTLGEGAYGCVSLIMNDRKEAIAMKTISLTTGARLTNTTINMQRQCVHREISLLEMARGHTNIINYFLHKEVDDVFYIFLEYANGGELFDQIEPDIGMPEHRVRYYFAQLISGVAHLHKLGIAHRDIKPENLLITENDRLLLSDFGFATLYRTKDGRTRNSTTRCGTRPYLAPEVLSESSYSPSCADVWSCGVVFVTMLCGQLPWNDATTECAYYTRYLNAITQKKCAPDVSPWNDMGGEVKDLLISILQPDPIQRVNVEQILQHSWLKPSTSDNKNKNMKRQPLSEKVCTSTTTTTTPPIDSIDDDINEAQHFRPRSASSNIDCTIGSDAVNREINDDEQEHQERPMKMRRMLPNKRTTAPVQSQPIYGTHMSPVKYDDNNEDCCDTPSKKHQQMSHSLCLSLPTNNADILLTQATLTQTQHLSNNIDPLTHLSKRMTRICTKECVERTYAYLLTAMQECGYYVQRSVCNCNHALLTITTTDRRRAQLVFQINVYDMCEMRLVDFRLSKGDGLEFKRAFMCMKKHLAAITARQSVNWMHDNGLTH